MSDVKRFGKQIEALAEKHKIKFFRQYGKNIANYAAIFNTESIEAELGELASTIKRLNKIWEEFNAT